LDLARNLPRIMYMRPIKSDHPARWVRFLSSAALGVRLITAHQVSEC